MFRIVTGEVAELHRSARHMNKLISILVILGLPTGAHGRGNEPPYVSVAEVSYQRETTTVTELFASFCSDAIVNGEEVTLLLLSEGPKVQRGRPFVRGARVDEGSMVLSGRGDCFFVSALQATTTFTLMRVGSGTIELFYEHETVRSSPDGKVVVINRGSFLVRAKSGEGAEPGATDNPEDAQRVREDH